MRVKLVESGHGRSTNFAANCQQRMQGLITKPHETFAHEVFTEFGRLSAVTSATDVADGVWHATTPLQPVAFPSGC
ncbi:hypothetical protein RDV84_13010 [Lysobacter yananisis]|uniref:Uncharacterized protein n=1 Tax=Lysobacter yananisis TaxID=1003114 RepID=A0ABY9PFM3_9GAMM|nr:hypothetical protein [Lysobacter yananisis]WMT05719.1 hypothetical protein RDV84_13010 [Lysobacter yananisis]